MSEPTIVYEHPNLQARRLGTLAPQPVQSFERGSGWYHIHSDWLGDAWVYQAVPVSDPAAYTPPDVVSPQPIDGDWVSERLELGAWWRNSPLDVMVIARNGDQIDPECFFPFGGPAHIDFSVRNVSEDAMALQPSTSFEIDIIRVNDRNDDAKSQIVWSGQLTPPHVSMASGVRQSLTFDWNQKDADGKQVSFGVYRVEIRLPVTIGYTMNGAEETQQQQVNTAILTSFPILIGAS